MYIENPKTAGSGIKCVIPQATPCSRGCKDCFFSNGKSYLEPLRENLPNLPYPSPNYVYRINDGNDSAHGQKEVIDAAQPYALRFYNTSYAGAVAKFDAPVVLTVNPTDDGSWQMCSSDNLMAIRFRLTTWNFKIAKQAIIWYANKGVTTILTWMAFNLKDSIPAPHLKNYVKGKRTLNEYFVPSYDTCKRYKKLVSESIYENVVCFCGEYAHHSCADCGNCLRLFFKKHTEQIENPADTKFW